MDAKNIEVELSAIRTWSAASATGLATHTDMATSARVKFRHMALSIQRGHSFQRDLAAAKLVREVAASDKKSSASMAENIPAEFMTVELALTRWPNPDVHAITSVLTAETNA